MRRPLRIGDGIELAEALLGLDGFPVLSVTETVEVVVVVETAVDKGLTVAQAKRPSGVTKEALEANARAGYTDGVIQC